MRPRPRIFFEAEVKVSHSVTMRPKPRPTGCLLLLQTFISYYSIQNFGEYLTDHKFRKYTSYNNNVSKYQKSYALRNNTENEVDNSVISIGMRTRPQHMRPRTRPRRTTEAENEVEAVKFGLEVNLALRT